MSALHLQVSGKGDTRRAAKGLEAVLGEGITIEQALAPTDDDRRAVDPVAIAALIVSIPAALLAVADLVDRIRARRKAVEVIEVAGKLTVEHRVEIHVVTEEGSRPLAGLTPDQLLDLANPSDPKR